MSIKLNKSEPLAVQQGNARGMVANTMTTTKFVNESKTRGKEMRMIEKRCCSSRSASAWPGQPGPDRQINEVLHKLDTSGELNKIWDKWLGPETEYKMTRTDKVVPLSELSSTRPRRANSRSAYH